MSRTDAARRPGPERTLTCISLGLSAASNLGINLALREPGRWGPLVTDLGFAIGGLSLVVLAVVLLGLLRSPVTLELTAAGALLASALGVLAHALPSPGTWGSLTAYIGLALVGGAATLRRPVFFAAFELIGITAWFVLGIVWHVPMDLYLHLVPVIPLAAAIATGFFLAQRHERRVQQGLIERLRSTADHDQLTGLLNRSGLHLGARRVWGDAEENGAPLWCAFVDIDHFKAINDAFGHDKGDRALRQVARALAAKVGESDLLCRWGGDEFVVFGAGRPPDESDLLDALSDPSATDVEPGPVLKVTVGVATSASAVDCTPDTLLDAADRRMYQIRGNRQTV
ncbi:diguanylate cyclase (GGDEF)-like protein [Nakamurella sp. UYEF19]|uniref:GGDEF domain-containing protein n=1 Tax=Nakamurella sp. UYEF19 TaxID=1756392 RepID=UPI0033995480